jgi:cell division septation protein DedD
VLGSGAHKLQPHIFGRLLGGASAGGVSAGAAELTEDATGAVAAASAGAGAVAAVSVGAGGATGATVLLLVWQATTPTTMERRDQPWRRFMRPLYSILDRCRGGAHDGRMSDEKKPDPVDDLKKGLGLLFRAAKTAVDEIPTGKLEEVVKTGAREVGRAIENVTGVIDEQIFHNKPRSKPPAPSATATPAAPAPATPATATPATATPATATATPAAPEAPKDPPDPPKQ